MSIKTILTSEERHLVLKKYFDFEQFEIVNCEESDLFNYESVSDTLYFLIKMKVLLKRNLKEITFVGKIMKNNRKKNLLREINYFNFMEKYSSGGSYNPILYYVRNDNQLLVFQDYFSEGFDVYKNIAPLDSEHIKLTLKTLATFHAGSIIFEENKSKDLKRTYRLTEDLKTGDIDLYNTWFQDKINRLKNVVQILDENNLVNQKLIDNLNCLVTNSISLIKSHKLRSVLCHGYLCDNNVLFKYNDNKEPTQCKLINFELQQYTSPVFDVLYFIFVVTRSKIRKLLLDDYLQWYYLCLKKELKLHDINVNKIIPYKEDYEVSVYRFLPFIKIYSTCSKISKNLISSDNSIIEKSNFSIEEYLKSNKYYKKVIIECIAELEDLIENKSLMLEDLYRIIKSKLKSTNYKLINYKVIPLEQFSGFLGNHNKLKVTVMFDNEKKVLNLFAKFTPSTEIQIKVTNDMGAFFKEIFIYNDLIPMMENNGISIINDCTVPCYFTRHNNVLIFDDYGFYGYKTLDSRISFELDTIKIVIKQLAKFHSATIILEEKLSKKQEESRYYFNKRYNKELQEAFIFKSKTHKGALAYNCGINTIENELNLFFGLDFTKSNPEVMKKIEKAFDAAFELVKPSNKFRNVICHGDLWANNILIRCDENGLPIDCRLIDFQLCRYCPPAHDLLTLIFLTTNRKFRKMNFNYLIELYYQEISNNLADYKYDIQKIIPNSSFMESVKAMMPQAICQSACSLQLNLLNSDITKEYMANEMSAESVLIGDRKEFITKLFQCDPIFKERTRDALEDLMEISLKYF